LEGLRKSVLWIIFILASTVGLAQVIEFPLDKSQFQEIIRIYTNDNRFIPGERILFKIENKMAGGKPSFISKVAYVELIDASRQSVLRSKFKLDDGVGAGHLYIPSYIKTGQYTLIAYTAWMLNYPKPFIAQLAIQVINPFNPIPASFLSDSVGITFYPEGGAYLLNELNRVGYRLSMKKPLRKVNIRVFSSEGEQLNSFMHDHPSVYGHFNFVPPSSGTFKVIVTDEDQNIYYDQLVVEDDSPFGLALGESGDNYQVKALNRSGNVQSLNIISWNNPSHKKSILVARDTVLSVIRHEWPQGLLYLYFEGTPVGRFIHTGSPKIVHNRPVSVHKEQYTTRALVDLRIPHVDDRAGVTLSVKKVYDEYFNSSYSSDWHDQLVNENFDAKELIDDFLISKRLHGPPLLFSKSTSMLPDYRGQLVDGQSGRVGSGGDNLVYLTSIEQSPFIRTAKVGDSGKFMLMVPETYARKPLMAFNVQREKVDLRERFLDEYSFVEINHNFDYTDISLWIKQKSIDVQIENNYYDFKKDFRLDSSQYNLLQGQINKSYDFDAYTRFPTVADIIVEIIPELRLRERNGRFEITMPYIESKPSAIDSVLVLVDGIPVLTNEFIRLNALQLKKVDLIFEQVKFGFAEYRGVAMFSSIDKDGSMLNGLNGYSKVDISPVEARVIYYQPNYAQTKSTMPDHRSQLLWVPDLDLVKRNTFEFYTSDLTGTFEVVFQARDNDGHYVIDRSTFEVVK